MLDARFWKNGLSAAMALFAAVLGLAALVAWVVRRQRYQRAAHHVLRLGLEIVDVAATIEEDLDRVRTRRAYPELRARCGEYRSRAEAIVAQGERLWRTPSATVLNTLGLLHDDHRRIVNLRSEADAVLAGRPFHGHATRAVKVVSRPGSHPSTWNSSGFCTKPSTLL